MAGLLGLRGKVRYLGAIWIVMGGLPLYTILFLESVRLTGLRVPNMPVVEMGGPLAIFGFARLARLLLSKLITVMVGGFLAVLGFACLQGLDMIRVTIGSLFSLSESVYLACRCLTHHLLPLTMVGLSDVNAVFTNASGLSLVIDR